VDNGRKRSPVGEGVERITGDLEASVLSHRHCGEQIYESASDFLATWHCTFDNQAVGTKLVFTMAMATRKPAIAPSATAGTSLSPGYLAHLSATRPAPPRG
jgi:hypothetical protein